jgi:hypothetical protein
MTGVTFSQDLVINVSLKQPKMLVIDAGDDISVEDPENTIIGEDITVTGGTSEYIYSWADGFGNSYNSKTVSVSSFGSYYLTVTDVNNCSAKDTLQVLNSVNINPIAAGNSSALFPNPSTGNVFIPVEGFKDELQISVVSVSGKEVFKLNIKIIPDESYREVDLEYLADGVYHIILEDARSRKTFKIVME